ncbi:MAG: ABC transporter substrate-binding protein [Gammaproteobacteria bacterium]|nr:ABC transporter substrate-binding protein [Gammaproteobacteria bacterium]MYC24541.1 ABC transporter substrate-binding protein [Gammaproteobacteria bacterium]
MLTIVLSVFFCVIGVVIGYVLGGKTSETTSADESPSTAISEEVFEWKMVTSWPKNLPAIGVAPERFAELVETMSNGRLKIKVYGANELVDPDEVFDSVSNGSAQMGHGAAYYWVGKAPAAVLFTTIPFGMTAQEMNAWIAYGGGLELWRELYEPFDVIPMACGNSGVQMGGWFNVEINTLDDLKGLVMRIPGLAGEVMQRAGAAPTTMPASELYTALQSGTIDATEWVGPYNDLALGLHDIAKYYYYPGWHEPGATIELIVNKQAFEELPADLQKIVEVASRAINQDMLDEFMARNNAALKTLMEEHNVELRRFPDEVLLRLKEISKEVLDELANKNSSANRIVTSYREFQTEVSQWTEIAEEAYFRARDL